MNPETTLAPIDFVLPWVDGSDPTWLAEKNRYLPQHQGLPDAASSSRYQDLGTLRYVLRSIAQNCPWYRRIHLITAGHYPEWLNIHHPKIRLVKHETLFLQPQNLPVFNSSAIEMNLVNLPDLSEQFVYLNDDTVFLRPVPPTRLFQNALPVDFLCHGWLKRNRLFEKLRGANSWVNALNNNIALINRAHNPAQLDPHFLFAPSYSAANRLSNALLQYVYRHYFWFEHWHLPQPYTRSTLQQVYAHYEPEILACTRNRFRASNDLTVYLNRYWHLASGQFVPEKHHDGFVRNIASLTQLQAAAHDLDTHQNIRFVCLNDTFQATSAAEYQAFKQAQTAFFERYLPQPAEFEHTHPTHLHASA